MSGEKIFVATLENQETIMEKTDSILAELKGQKPKRYGFRVKQNESNPSARVEYLYDAVGMTPAYMNFNTGAFDYGSWANLWFVRDNFPCMVKSNGVVDYRLDPNNYGLKEASGVASDVANTAYDGNAMSAIPLCWVKRYTEGGYRYVIFCETKYDDGYEAYAHRNNEGRIVPYAFHAIFEGHIASSKLRSLSGVAPTSSTTASAEETAAQANNSGTARWHIRSWALNELIFDLLTLIGKSTNLQATFGQGHSTGGSSAADLLATGSLNTKGQFFGYNTTTQAVKVFHMENFYADRWERICGLVYINGSYLAKMDESGGNYNFDGTDYVAVCDGVNGAEASGGYVKEATQNEFGWFPSVLGGSETTYDCDYHYYNNEGTRVPVVGGACNAGGWCGRYLYADNAASAAGWNIGASLSLVSPS